MTKNKYISTSFFLALHVATVVASEMTPAEPLGYCLKSVALRPGGVLDQSACRALIEEVKSALERYWTAQGKQIPRIKGSEASEKWRDWFRKNSFSDERATVLRSSFFVIDYLERASNSPRATPEQIVQKITPSGQSHVRFLYDLFCDIVDLCEGRHPHSLRSVQIAFEALIPFGVAARGCSQLADTFEASSGELCGIDCDMDPIITLLALGGFESESMIDSLGLLTADGERCTPEQLEAFLKTVKGRRLVTAARTFESLQVLIFRAALTVRRDIELRGHTASAAFRRMLDYHRHVGCIENQGREMIAAMFDSVGVERETYVRYVKDRYPVRSFVASVIAGADLFPGTACADSVVEAARMSGLASFEKTGHLSSFENYFGLSFWRMCLNDGAFLPYLERLKEEVKVERAKSKS